MWNYSIGKGGVMSATLDAPSQRVCAVYLALMLTEFETARAGVLRMGNCGANSFSAGSLGYYDNAISTVRRMITGLGWKRDPQKWADAEDMVKDGRMTSIGTSGTASNSTSEGNADGDERPTRGESRSLFTGDHDTTGEQRVAPGRSIDGPEGGGGVSTRAPRTAGQPSQGRSRHRPGRAAIAVGRTKTQRRGRGNVDSGDTENGERREE